MTAPLFSMRNNGMTRWDSIVGGGVASDIRTRKVFIHKPMRNIEKAQLTVEELMELLSEMHPQKKVIIGLGGKEFRFVGGVYELHDRVDIVACSPEDQGKPYYPYDRSEGVSEISLTSIEELLEG